MSGEGTIPELTNNLESLAIALPRSVSTTLQKSDELVTNSPAATPEDGAEVGTLEWAQVIELQAFSDRKVWIEEKTRVHFESSRSL